VRVPSRAPTAASPFQTGNDCCQPVRKVFLSRMTRRRIALGVLGPLALIGAALLMLDPKGDAQSPGGHPSQRGGINWAQLVQSGLAELHAAPAQQHWPFSALQEPTRRMPDGLREGALENLGHAEPLKLRFNQAIHSPTMAGIGFWVVPGRGVTCMVEDRTPAAACDMTARVAREGLQLEVYKSDPRRGGRPSHFLALGMVPDGISRVKARIGRRAESIPVIGNAYGWRAEVPIAVRSLRH
jgi:hypothetical protein